MRKQLGNLILILAIAIASIGSEGCKKYVQHPGSVNTFDSQTYDVLLAAEGAIKQGKADYSSGALPDAGKPYLDDLIRVYDVANASYRTYHDAATKGQDSAALATKLQQDIASLESAITAFRTNAKKTGGS